MYAWPCLLTASRLPITCTFWTNTGKPLASSKEQIKPFNIQNFDKEKHLVLNPVLKQSYSIFLAPPSQAIFELKLQEFF